MKLTYSIRTATRGLFTHKSRTALTILGIVIGITAIILIASLGKAAQNLVLGQLQSLGSNIVVVVPGKEPKGPTDPSVADSLFSDSLKERELEAIENKANVPKVSSVMPVVFGSDSVAYGGETYRPMILGTSELIADIFDLFPAMEEILVFLLFPEAYWLSQEF